jgi:hypothetical protein
MAQPDNSHSKRAPVEFDWDAVTLEHTRSLARATRSDHVGDDPPTFATIYRWGEFEWLKRLGVDLRTLLHTEQEYEYLAPLVVGERPRVSTSIRNTRSKAGMTFITLETVITSGGKPAVKALTNFVVKGALEVPA